MKKFKFTINADLKNFCTFHIGGKAKLLFTAKTRPELINVCRWATKHNIKYKIIGLGANLLFNDLGFNGLVIVNKTNKIKFKKNNVWVDGGTNLTSLIMQCYNKSLSGIERLIGIPSTVGGAVVNSLGAFDTNFCNFVEYVQCYNKKNLSKKLKLYNIDCNFNYRSSLFKSNEYIITRIKLKLNYGNKTLIKDEMDKAITKKANTQPICQFSAGSVFKRGKIIPAKAIDELGLKGTKIGGAEVSTQHAGFIVNTGNATSDDVKQLISLIEEKIKSAYNVNLEREIEFVDY